MKKIFKYFLLLFSGIMLSGCLIVDTKISVNPDGSGTIEEKVLMKDSFVEMFSGFMDAFADSVKEKEFSLFNEEEFKSKASEYGEDVKYVSGKEVKIEGWQGSRVVYAFEDITEIKFNPDPDDKISLGLDEESGDTEEVKEYIRFDFDEGEPSALTVIFPPKNFDEEESEEPQEGEENILVNEFVKLMEGMRISLSLNINGEIENTNASYVKGNEITLFDFDIDALIKNKDKFEEFKNKKPDSLEEMKELVKEVPEIKIEFEDQIVVEFNK